MVATFDVRPLEEFHYLKEIVEDENERDTIQIGKVDWSNYSVKLSVQHSQLPLSLKWNG